MWRKLLKVLLYSSLVIGTLGGLSIMTESDAIVLGLALIVVVWLSASVFGLILEVATDISKIADNSKEINETLKNIFLPSADKSDDTKGTEGNQEEKKISTEKPHDEDSTVKEQTIKKINTWTCKCGKENPLKNNFCTECGEKRP